MKTRKCDVEEFLTILGYERIERNLFSVKNATPFLYYRDEDYKYITGVLAEVFLGDDGVLEIHTRTSIWCSRYDLDFQNFTIKHLKKRFGGYFISDLGRNRYLKCEGSYLQKAEAGCHQAYYRFCDNVETVQLLLRSAEDLGKGFPSIRGMPELNIANPQTLLANMLVPFLVSVLEEYFRSTYIALLKYSAKRESITANARIGGDELVSVSRGELSFEEAVARTKSFQDIKRICQSFREIDSDLDIGGLLKKPYHRRKESIYETLERVISQRHKFIHMANIDPSYMQNQAKKDIRAVAIGIGRVYQGLIRHHKWSTGYGVYNTLSKTLGIWQE
jgi:hypothetical protein